MGYVKVSPCITWNRFRKVKRVGLTLGCAWLNNPERETKYRGLAASAGADADRFGR